MQLVEQAIEEADGGVIDLAGDGLTVGGLHHLQVPGREFIPEELIDGHQGLAQTVLAKEVGYLSGYSVLLGFEPIHGQTG